MLYCTVSNNEMTTSLLSIHGDIGICCRFPLVCAMVFNLMVNTIQKIKKIPFVSLSSSLLLCCSHQQQSYPPIIRKEDLNKNRMELPLSLYQLRSPPIYHSIWLQREWGHWKINLFNFVVWEATFCVPSIFLVRTRFRLWKSLLLLWHYLRF